MPRPKKDDEGDQVDEGGHRLHEVEDREDGGLHRAVLAASIPIGIPMIRQITVATSTSASVTIASSHSPRLMMNTSPPTVNSAIRQPASSSAITVRMAIMTRRGGKAGGSQRANDAVDRIREEVEESLRSSGDPITPLWIHSSIGISG